MVGNERSVLRHPVVAPTIDGLYFATSTVEAEAGVVDITACAGLTAAREVLRKRG
jgi:hypothetical protein